MNIQPCRSWLLAGCLVLATPLLAQTAATVRDLESLTPKTLTREELLDLMPNAKVSRTVANGNLHLWTQAADGSFTASSDNRSTNSIPSTAQGKWRVSDDGRYCSVIQWRSGPEDWCRFVISTSAGYYTARALEPGTERVYKFEFKK